MDLFLLLCDVFPFVFWKKLKTPKKHFEIIWPLVESRESIGLQSRTVHSSCWSVLDFWKINLEKSKFNKSISNWIFTACKNQFQNCFLRTKYPVCRGWSLQFDFSKIMYRSTGGKCLYCKAQIWIEIKLGTKVNQ